MPGELLRSHFGGKIISHPPAHLKWPQLYFHKTTEWFGLEKTMRTSRSTPCHTYFPLEEILLLGRFLQLKISAVREEQDLAESRAGSEG